MRKASLFRSVIVPDARRAGTGRRMSGTPTGNQCQGTHLREAARSVSRRPGDRAASWRGCARARSGTTRSSARGSRGRCWRPAARLGYRRVTIRDLLERSGGYRAQFYRNFANKAECYATAYEVEIERLCAALLRAAAAEQSSVVRAAGCAARAGTQRLRAAAAGPRIADRSPRRRGAGAGQEKRDVGAPHPRYRQRAPRDRASPLVTSYDCTVHGKRNRGIRVHGAGEGRAAELRGGGAGAGAPGGRRLLRRGGGRRGVDGCTDGLRGGHRTRRSEAWAARQDGAIAALC